MPAGHFDGDASRYSGGRLSADPNVPGGTERRADMLEVELPGVADELKNAVHRLSTAGKSANVAPLSKCSMKIRPTLRVKATAVMAEAASPTAAAGGRM